MQKTNNISKIINNWYSHKYHKKHVISSEMVKLKTGTYTEAYKFNFLDDSTFFVKRKKKNDLDNDNLNEYNTMKKLWPYYSTNKNFFIPKPIDYLDKHELLITEYVEGVKLSNIFSRNCIIGLPNKYFLDAEITILIIVKRINRATNIP